MSNTEKKEFTVTGNCVPGKHYMADTSDKLAEIMALVESGKYFCINRARQYGKTTTLSLLTKKLIASNEYIPISISFEGADDEMFEKTSEFCKRFLELCAGSLKDRGLPGAEVWNDSSIESFISLENFLTDVCRDKKYVLIIDEVDKSSDNIIFLKFLGLLRKKFLLRNDGIGCTFHSVILAGVTDIKNLKIKIKESDKPQLENAEERINSPWNIAVDFVVDMSLSVKEISYMLADYENEHHTGMNIETISSEIRAYTNGYPYLVSRICQTIDTKLEKDWTINGIMKAIKIMLSEESELNKDIFKNLNNNKNLDTLMFNIVALGMEYTYSLGIPEIGLGITYGFLLKRDDNVVIIANKFFESLFYNHYTTKLQIDRKIARLTKTSEVIFDGKLNMEILIEKFAQHYYESYRKSLKEFVESECRMLFLTYLKPIINGVGFAHVESETRDEQRMDVVVDYGAEQFIIELKLWYGNEKYEEALDQVVGYLNRKNKDVGYLLTFDFRKRDNVGAPQIKWVEHGGKKIFDVIVGMASPEDR